jgi:pyrophosphatase PpaX
VTPGPGEGYDPVLFDLDGTVIDSVALIRESHRHAVREVLGREPADDVLVAGVGRPLIEQMRAFDPERAEELLAVYRAWNHENTAVLLRPYPGLEETLRALRDDGRRLGIVTSKSGPTVRLAFDVLPLERYFDVVIAAEDTTRHKPGPEPILLALRRLGSDPDRACYVGDSPFDLAAARAAGIDAIGVTWGFFAAAALAPETPRALVRTPERLLAACRGEPV